MIFSYVVKPYDVTVTVEAEDSDDAQPIRYEGQQAGLVSGRLADAYGIYGHRFNPDGGTPIDLEAALISIFGAEAIERTGETSAQSELPQGALS